MAGYPHSYNPYGGAPPPSRPHHVPLHSPYAPPPPPNTYGAPPPLGSSYLPPSTPPAGYAGGPGGVYPYAASRPFYDPFPRGTDPNIVAIFWAADEDRNGLVDDKELQGALTTSCHHVFNMRTVHLLMQLFAGERSSKIGPTEFVSLFYSLQNWRAIFDKFDRDRDGRMDASGLQEALRSLEFSVSPAVLDILVTKLDRPGNKTKALLEYDSFIECCLIVKGLTDKFKENDPVPSGTASFTYDSFLRAVLPFFVA